MSNYEGFVREVCASPTIGEKLYELRGRQPRHGVKALDMVLVGRVQYAKDDEAVGLAAATLIEIAS